MYIRSLKKLLLVLMMVALPPAVFAGKGANIHFHNYTNSKIHLYTGYLDGFEDGSKFDIHVGAHKTHREYIETTSSTSHNIKIYVGGRKSHRMKVSYSLVDNYSASTKDDKKLDIIAYVRTSRKAGEQANIDFYIITEDYSDWMTRSHRIQKSSLKEITIVGAHDAGMGKSENCTKLASKRNTRTQGLSYMGLLRRGVRYFDSRPVITKDGMYLGHYGWLPGDGYEGCTGYSVNAMLDDVKKFLAKKSRRHEVVLLDFSHFMNFKRDGYGDKNTKFTSGDFDWLIKKIDKKIGEYLVKGNKEFLSTNIEDLTTDGPKVIVVFDKEGYKGDKGIYSKKYLALYDSYSDTNDFDKMKEDQYKKLRKHHEKYFLLAWTLTLSTSQAAVTSSIKELAKEANDPAHLNKLIGHVKKKNEFPNILNVDFANSIHTRTAINMRH